MQVSNQRALALALLWAGLAALAISFQLAPGFVRDGGYIHLALVPASTAIGAIAAAWSTVRLLDLEQRLAALPAPRPLELAIMLGGTLIFGYGLNAEWLVRQATYVPPELTADAAARLLKTMHVSVSCGAVAVAWGVSRLLQVKADSYEDVWNSLQRIDAAAAMLPTYAARHHGGLEAFTENIVDAIGSASEQLKPALSPTRAAAAPAAAC